MDHELCSTVQVNRDWCTDPMYRTAAGPSKVCVPHVLTKTLQIAHICSNQKMSEKEVPSFSSLPGVNIKPSRSCFSLAFGLAIIHDAIVEEIYEYIQQYQTSTD